MAFQEKQFRAAQAIHVPEVEPMPPPPTMSTADAEASALEMRRAQLRRYGFRRTVRAGGAGGAVGGGRGLGGTMEVAA
jgi:hypothetical protein